MEWCLFIVFLYAAFITGTLIQVVKSHKKWEAETLPLVRDNARLRTLLELHGIEADKKASN